MKKLTSVLVLLCLLTGVAFAETVNHDGAAFAIGTMQQMIDKAADAGVEFPRAWRLADVDAASPAHVAVLTASEAQIALLDSMAAEGTPGLGVLGETINRQFSADYAAAAKALTLSGTDAPAGEKPVLLWVMYDFHICLCLIRPDGTWESTLAMSDRDVLKGFSEDYLSQTVSQLFGEMEIIILK